MAASIQSHMASGRRAPNAVWIDSRPAGSGVILVHARMECVGHALATIHA